MGKIIYYDDGTPKQLKEVGFIDCKELPLKEYFNITHSATGLFARYEGKSLENILNYSDTENVEDASYMFYSCMQLLEVPELDFSNVTHASEIFDGCYNVTRIKIKNLKVMFSLTDCNSLTRDAFIEIFNNIGIPAEPNNGIFITNRQRALLTEEDIAIATNKG